MFQSVAKLQKVQNALSCIVYKLDRMNLCHTKARETPVLTSYFLFIYLFKYNLPTFKAIFFSKLHHLSSLIKSSSLTHGNRLSGSISHPKKVIGSCGFALATPVEGTGSH